MVKAFAIFSIVFLLNSCSSIKTIKSKEHRRLSNGSVHPDQVDLNINENNTNPNDKGVELLPPEETIRIGEHGGDVYSSDEAKEESQHAESKKLRIGLSLGPGIYRTINYVSFLKIMERQNLSPDIITGTEFGAIVAAMYATGMTPEVIEWNFYKYFKEKKKNKPYEKDWLDEVDEKLLIKFKNVNIQDTKKKFFITLNDHRDNKTYYFDKGNVRDLLLLNLKLSNSASGSQKSVKYSAAFEKEVFNARLLRQVGAEFTMAADVLGNKFEFENSNEYLTGIYGRVSGRIQREIKSFDYYVTLSPSSTQIDSTKEGSLFMQKSYEFMQKQVPTILKKMQAKIENLSNSGNDK
jgi:hypothetical protein